MQKAAGIRFAFLPEISRVEVVHLAPLRVQKSGWLRARMEKAREAPCVQLEGESAQGIARLWRELPLISKKEIRRHHPHGLRFGRAESLLEASLCWKCHNIFGESNGNRVFGEFDAKHSRAQKLLAQLQGVWNQKEQL